MLDFKKLMDTEHSAKVRAEYEQKALEQAANDKELMALVDKCLDSYEQLAEKERSLVRTCRFDLLRYKPLSFKQEAWLRDIAARIR